MRQSGIGIGIYFAFFIGLGVLAPLIVVAALQSTQGQGTFGGTDVIFSSMIFVGILAGVSSSSDFKFFIQNGFSRGKIVWISILSIAIVSVAQGLIITALALIVNNVFPTLYSVEVLFATSYAYGGFGVMVPTSHFFLIWFLSAVMLFLASSIGLLIGIFLDRTGTVVRLIVCATVIVVVPLLISIFQFLPMWWKAFFGRLVGFGENGHMTPWPFAATLLVISALVCAGAALLNRRREIKRVNA
jgi:hypothetical protein